MTTRRLIGGVVLAVAALAGFGDGFAQGAGARDGQGAPRRSDTASLQLQLLEATKQSNELAAEQNRQSKNILEQTNALAEASARQSAEAEQTRQTAEASIAQNLQALEYMKVLSNRTLQTAQSRETFVKRVFMFWSAVLAVFVLVAAYFNWREHKNMREKVEQTVNEMRNVGLDELQKMLDELRAEKLVLLDEVARHRAALASSRVEDS